MSLRRELQELERAARAKRSADAQRTVDALLEELRQVRLAKMCLQAGETAPDFELPDANGRMVSLEDALRKGPVVIAFYRGGWCPYCSLALRALQRALPEIRAAGASLLAISPQTNPGAHETRDRLDIQFPLLTDRGNRVARLFGLTFEVPDELKKLYRRVDIDLGRINGVAEWELPIPATYVIGADGDVKHAFIEVDFTERAEPSEIVAAVRRLAAAGLSGAA